MAKTKSQVKQAQSGTTIVGHSVAIGQSSIALGYPSTGSYGNYPVSIGSSEMGKICLGRESSKIVLSSGREIDLDLLAAFMPVIEQLADVLCIVKEQASQLEGYHELKEAREDYEIVRRLFGEKITREKDD